MNSAMDERVRRRLKLRRSSAASPHRNRYREQKIDPWEVDGFHDWCCAEELCDCEADE